MKNAFISQSKKSNFESQCLMAYTTTYQGDKVNKIRKNVAQNWSPFKREVVCGALSG